MEDWACPRTRASPRAQSQEPRYAPCKGSSTENIPLVEGRLASVLVRGRAEVVSGSVADVCQRAQGPTGSQQSQLSPACLCRSFRFRTGDSSADSASGCPPLASCLSVCRPCVPCGMSRGCPRTSVFHAGSPYALTEFLFHFWVALLGDLFWWVAWCLGASPCVSWAPPCQVPLLTHQLPPTSQVPFTPCALFHQLPAL